jgi:hypothetical protein
MDAQAEFAATRQTTAEINALRNLWISLIPTCTPTFDATYRWLQQLSYYEVGKCIHATERLHRKYAGKLEPWQLLKYMELCANKALKENYGTDSKQTNPGSRVKTEAHLQEAHVED